MYITLTLTYICVSMLYVHLFSDKVEKNAEWTTESNEWVSMYVNGVKKHLHGALVSVVIRCL